MSLLFERALSVFSPAETRHLRVEGSGLDGGMDGDEKGDDGRRSVPLDHLVRLVSNRADALAHPDREDWLCVPLHGTDTAELTGEYVVFEDHSVRGPLFVYRDAETGEPTAVDCEAAGTTRLGARLRFWVPSFTPDERPSYDRGGPRTRVTPSNPVPEDDREAYFERLLGFIADERDAERERNRELVNRHSPRELADHGEDAIPELTGFATLSDGSIQCHAVVDSGVELRRRFGVFEDDEVLLCGPDDPEFPLAATVERITDRTVDLLPAGSVDRESVVDRLESADSAGLALLLNPVTFDREEGAVREVREDPERRSLVVGARDVRFGGATAARTPRFDDALDDSQAFAATCALYAEDVFCIHGPPGTGKTRTLIEVVRRAVADGERVLVCADSNQGVDNALVGTSTEDELDETSLHYHAEVGEEFVLDRHHAYHSDSAFVRDRYDDDPERPDVVATTNNSAADLPDDSFDLAVVDEATQSTVESAFVPFTKAETLVLAGDHRQLPPYSATDQPDDERYRSLFEQLYPGGGVYGPSVGVSLTTQYRMHPDVAAFPNRSFYGGELKNGREVAPVDGFPPLVGVDVDGRERRGDGHSYYNREEASEVASLVERLLDADVTPGEVSVITPYRAQIDAVNAELREVPGGDDVEVDTVDSFQGSEREAVVVSFVRSNERGDVGFLGREPDGPRRLNVALTRAERFCGLVGDWDTLRDGGDGRNAYAELYRDLYERATEDWQGREDDGAARTPSGNETPR